MVSEPLKEFNPAVLHILRAFAAMGLELLSALLSTIVAQQGFLMMCIELSPVTKFASGQQPGLLQVDIYIYCAAQASRDWIGGLRL